MDQKATNNPEISETDGGILFSSPVLGNLKALNNTPENQPVMIFWDL